MARTGYPGVTRTTLELLQWWQRDGREKRLFYAQLEAAETVIFLTEARADFRQGIDVPREDPSDEKKAEGFTGFSLRVQDGHRLRQDDRDGDAGGVEHPQQGERPQRARFSDVVLVVCPNVTIRSRLPELDPEAGEASIYRTRDLVPPHLMPC